MNLLKQENIMAKLKIMSDKHIAKAITDQLEKRGVDVVLRVETVEMDEASDEELLEYATREGRAFLTFDDDFEVLNSEWFKVGKSHCGIFRCGGHLLGDKGIGRVVTSIAEYHDLLVAGVGTQEDLYNEVTHIN